DTLGERDRAQAIAKARAFVLRVFDTPARTPNLRDAHERGATKDEADQLAAPLPPLSPRGLYWSLTRASLRLGGALSQGVALGHATGFDSRRTPDHVYRNQARGVTPLGRAIDRNYLDSIGWRGIRQRKLNLEELLQKAMDDLRRTGTPVRILDIAAGHGRYVLDAIDRAGALPDSILLRDYSKINVEQGGALIRARNLDRIASFVEGDAFDRANLAAIAPRPTIGIVSGLYELF